MPPRLILIADQFTRKQIAIRVQKAVRAGVRWVHLRDHQASNSDFYVAALALVKVLQEVSPDVLISINGHPEIALELGLHYHTGIQGQVITARKNLKTGYSVHKIEEGEGCVAAGADYLIYSPIYPTMSKPGHKGVGLVQLKKFCKTVVPAPVYALGGITPERVPACLQAGAYGVAVLSGILEADVIKEEVQKYLKAALTTEA